jgi:hypothetical protein
MIEFAFNGLSKRHSPFRASIQRRVSADNEYRAKLMFYAVTSLSKNPLELP